MFLPTWVAEALAAEISERNLSGDDRLFTIPYDTVYKEHRRACKLAGITRYSMHDHRHTAAVHLCRAGMPLDLLRDQLGHTSIKQTEKYCCFHPDYNDVARYFVLGLFAAVALSLAVIGIYGVMAYNVGRRAREFGIRQAMGASPRVVRLLVFRHSAAVVGLGVVAGLVGALALSRVLRSMLFQVSATDPLTFLAVALALALVAILAAYVPARRATRVDPVETLRYE